MVHFTKHNSNAIAFQAQRASSLFAKSLGALIKPLNTVIRKGAVALIVCASTLTVHGQQADPVFVTGSGFTSTSSFLKVNKVLVQSDGKVLAGGSFSSYNGTSRFGIARLNTNGSLDASFVPGTDAGAVVNTFALQADGKIIVAGSYLTSTSSPIDGLIRLNINGTVDASFNSAYFNGQGVNSVLVLPDGKIIVNGLARLNTDGSIDQTYSNTAYPAERMLRQADGKLIISGTFSSVAGPKRLARLNQDGSLDASFSVTGPGFNFAVHDIALQSDGKIIVGGEFTQYNSQTQRSIARLNSDGSLDATFSPSTSFTSAVYAVALQPDGKVIFAGRTFLGRLNSNGSNDPTFNAAGTIGTKYIYTVALQADGKIIAGGDFLTYNNAPYSCIVRVLNNTANAVPGVSSGSPLTVYPNPSTGRLTVKMEEAVPTNSRITVYDVLGARLQQQVAGQYTDIDLNYPSGTYLLQITTPEGLSHSVIVKKQ